MPTFDPNRPDFTPYGFTCVQWTPSPMRRPDHHNEIELNLLSTGWVTYLLGGKKVRIEAGGLSAFWAAIPHQILEYGEGTHYYVATIPFAWFLQCRLPEDFVQALLRGEILTEQKGETLLADLGLFHQWEKDLGSTDKSDREIVMLEVQARLLRMAKRMPARPAPSRKAAKAKVSKHLQEGSLNKVEQMACLIAQRYTEQLTVEDISKAVDLHPNYAMNLFKKTFGTTLLDYLTHHRISHAQRLLATTDEKIVDIALASGFNSISRFNDAFRRACDCSPREFRNTHDQASTQNVTSSPHSRSSSR